MKQFLAYLICILFVSCGTAHKQQSIKSPQDLKDKKIIVASGSTQEVLAMTQFPQAEIIRVQNISDMYVTLKAGKGDVVIDDYNSAKTYQEKKGGVSIPIDSVATTPIGVAFSKDHTDLRDQFNVFLKEIKADGTYQEIINRWMSDNATLSSMPNIPNPEDKGSFTFGCTGVDFPYTFVKNGKPAGLDIELVSRFAAKYGLKMEVKSFNFNSLITAISTGKIDVAANCISITAERSKKINFSNPYLSTNTAVVTLSKNAAEAETGIWSSLKKNVDQTFVQDSRYLLLLDGIGCTIRISIFSVLFGTLLGFLICWMRMSNKQCLVAFTKAYIYFFRGIPQVVLLMLLFYAIFASTSLSGEVVSVIAFSMSFSAYVCEMFRTSIESVGKGQTEACLAMGFTPWQSFRLITFPITVQRVFPVYIGEVIALIKSTSIVGYITVEDLTKVSDMIRSLTFDAFFSLIVVTIIYFILIVLTINGLKIIQKHTARKQHKFYKL